MLITLVSAILCQAGSLVASFDGPAREYAARISEGGGVRYSVDAALQDEPILIRSPNQTLESPRIRELVAQAFEGEWVQTRPKEFRLVIAPATAKRLEERDLETRRQALMIWLAEMKRVHRTTDKAQVAKLLEELSSYERRVLDGTFVRNFVMSYDPPTPEIELLRALLLELGPSALAKVPPGETRSWSDAPVGAQERFPAGSLAAIATYQSASEMLGSALGKEDLPKVNSYPWEAFMAHLGRDRRSCKYVLTAMATFRAPVYRLRVYDQRGEQLDAVGLFGPSSVRLPGHVEVAAPPSLDQISLTESSAEFMRLFLGGQRSIDQGVRRAAPDAKLLASKEFEPVSVGFGELFADVSARKGKTLVAYLPDASTTDALANCKEDVVAGNSLWTKLVTGGLVQLDASTDALVLRPDNPVLARRERVARIALRHYAEQVLERQGTSPRIECTFNFEGGPGSTLSPISTAWGKSLLPLVSPRFGQIRYWLGALLGGLGDPHWAELEAGRALPIKNLSPPQQLAFRRWLEFGGPGPYLYEPTVAASNAIYDYQLELELADDPLVECTTPGEGLWGYLPPVPTRLSEVVSTLAFNKLKPEQLATTFDGRHALVSSTAYTAVGRLGRVEWVRDDVGDLKGRELARDVGFRDWPETLRTRMLRALGGG